LIHSVRERGRQQMRGGTAETCGQVQAGTGLTTGGACYGRSIPGWRHASFNPEESCWNTAAIVPYPG
jgi:hypothetical protein